MFGFGRGSHAIACARLSEVAEPLSGDIREIPQSDAAPHVRPLRQDAPTPHHTTSVGRPRSAGTCEQSVRSATLVTGCCHGIISGPVPIWAPMGCERHAGGDGGGVRYARSVPAAQWSCEKRGVGCGNAPAKSLGDCGGKRRRQPQHGGASERDWAAGRRRPPGHFQKLPRSGALAHAPSFGQDASMQRRITSACRTRSDAQSKRCVGPALTPRAVFVALSQAKYP